MPHPVNTMNELAPDRHVIRSSLESTLHEIERLAALTATAEGGLKDLFELVSEVRDLAVEAAGVAGPRGTATLSYQFQVDSLLAKIDRTTHCTRFEEVHPLLGLEICIPPCATTIAEPVLVLPPLTLQGLGQDSSERLAWLALGERANLVTGDRRTAVRIAASAVRQLAQLQVRLAEFQSDVLAAVDRTTAVAMDNVKAADGAPLLDESIFELGPSAAFASGGARRIEGLATVLTARTWQ
jgi:hypothetical protein